MFGHAMHFCSLCSWCGMYCNAALFLVLLSLSLVLACLTLTLSFCGLALPEHPVSSTHEHTI